MTDIIFCSLTEETYLKLVGARADYILGKTFSFVES